MTTPASADAPAAPSPLPSEPATPDRRAVAAITIGVLLLVSLYFTSLYSYVLFHSLVESVSAVIAGGIFMFAWTSRHLQRDDFFVVLGAGFLFIGLVDILHALAYHGLHVFPDSDGNTATQLWVVAGLIRSGVVIGALFAVGRRVSPVALFGGLALLTAASLALIFVWPVFPDCYTPEMGLTTFKIACEWLFAAAVVVAILLLWRHRDAFSRRVRRLLVAALVLMAGSELLFSLYTSVYGPLNLAGHYAMLVAYFLIYRGIIHTGLLRPSELLFRDLKVHQEALERTRDELEQRVNDRTRELADTNARLRSEIATAAALHRQLREAQKMEAIGTMAGGIAHDFNNILTPILGYAELVRDGLPPDGDDHRALDQILVAGRRAKALVRQILTFSRQSEQQRSLVDLATLVDETARLLRATLPATIALRTEIEDPSRPVFADPVQIHQVLMNLCTNAFQAMRGSAGTLSIRLRAVVFPDAGPLGLSGVDPGAYMRLTVADTGPGIPPAVLERVFEPYFTTKGPGEGTGLGLSIVHGIVRSHGGHVTVESEADRGTTFHVFLRCADDGLDIAVDDAAPARLERGTERLVVVDDEPTVAELLERTLAGLGYRVTAFTDGREALDHVRAAPHAVDLVLSDVTMPGMTGEALAQALLRARPDLPILLSTGFSERIDAPAAARFGVRDLLTKPVPRHVLARAVRDALDD